MIYLDSSAVLKLVHEEAESAALVAWLAERPDVPLVSSELARVEVLRGARRIDASAVPAARAVLAQLELIPLGGAVVDAAAELDPLLLRSLDALHLAAAGSLGEALEAFVAYDRRLAEAAADAGLDVLAPR